MKIAALADPSKRLHIVIRLIKYAPFGPLVFIINLKAYKLVL